MHNNQAIIGNEYLIRENQLRISPTNTQGKITYANQNFIEMSDFQIEKNCR